MKGICNKSILVVDDDPSMLRAIEKVLTSEGAIVTCAAWPGKAVETLSDRRKPLDLVVTDLRMPFVSGEMLVDAIHRNLPAVPVIVLTAFSSPAAKALCYKRGAVAVLEKPLDSTQLLSSIESALDASPAGHGKHQQTPVKTFQQETASLPAYNHSGLRSIKQLYGHSLGTAEGEIGTVKDFYFDDEQWAVRYVVADTGAWLRGRLVLLSSNAFGNFQEDGDSLLVNLTRQQIENSPAIATHKPVSRQFEEDYYHYYGWPTYWAGGGMWGVGGFPMVPPPLPIPTQVKNSGADFVKSNDPHLRSTKAVSGYHIETPEGTIGHVSDFMIDVKSWAIHQLVVETGHWFAGKEIVLSPSHVTSISYDESKVLVNVTKETIREAPEYHMPQPAYHDSRNFNI